MKNKCLCCGQEPDSPLQVGRLCFCDDCADAQMYRDMHLMRDSKYMTIVGSFLFAVIGICIYVIANRYISYGYFGDMIAFVLLCVNAYIAILLIRLSSRTYFELRDAIFLRIASI